jgi:hypothetical protein
MVRNQGKEIRGDEATRNELEEVIKVFLVESEDSEFEAIYEKSSKTYEIYNDLKFSYQTLNRAFSLNNEQLYKVSWDDVIVNIIFKHVSEKSKNPKISFIRDKHGLFNAPPYSKEVYKAFKKEFEALPLLRNLERFEKYLDEKFTNILNCNSSQFNDLFKLKFNFKFPSLIAILRGNCYGLTVKQYDLLISFIKEIDKKKNSARSHVELSTAIKEKIYELKMPKECFFYPLGDWDSQSCFDWIKLIGMQIEKCPPDLSGSSILTGNVFSFFTQKQWEKIVNLFTEYRENLIISHKNIKYREFALPEYSELVHVDLKGLYEKAFEQEYKKLEYSCEDFTNLAQELLTGVPCPPPGKSVPKNIVYDFFAPYSAVLQSSMAGKTRFLLDPIKENKNYRVLILYCTMKSNIGIVGSKFINGLYSMLRTDPLKITTNYLETFYERIIQELRDENGFLKPEYSSKGSVMIDDILSKANLQKERPEKFNLEIFVSKTNKKQVIPVLAIDEAHELLTETFDDEPKYGLIMEKRRTSTKILEDSESEMEDSEIDPETMDNSMSGSISNPIRYCSTLISHFSSYAGKKRAFDSIGNYSEASKGSVKKITRFTLLRRCLRSIQKLYSRLTIPTILCSTYSNIGNFMPNILHDPSRRELIVHDSFPTKKHLHRVFLLQESFDIYSRHRVIVQNDLYQYLKSADFLRNLMMEGRPAWGSLCLSAEAEKLDKVNIFKSVIEAAVEKLSIDCNDVKNIDALALLGHTIWIGTFSTSDWASEIVRSKLGFMQYVDTVNGFLESTFCPEPVLAVAASIILFTTSSDMLCKVLEKYRTITEHGFANIGECGEFSARLILFIAKMMAKSVDVSYEVDKNLVPALPVTLDSFFSFFAKIPNNAKIAGDYLDGLVSFTHYIKIVDEHPRSFNDLNGLLLDQALCRSSAIIPPDHCLGVDIMIPLVTASKASTWLLVQVKNREIVNFAEAQRQMIAFSMNLKCGVPPVFLILHLVPEISTVPPTFRALQSNMLYLKGTKFLSALSQKVKKSFSRTDYETETLNNVISDLSVSHRNAKSRQTPKFAFFHRELINRFTPKLI